jgi:NADP-dependent aldehyde dehydrogenase
MSTLLSYRPRTGEPVGDPIETTSSEQLDQLVHAATDAAPAWRSSAASERAGVLDAVAAALDADVDALVSIADDETALGDARLRGEVARTTGQLRMFADVLRDGSYVDAILSPADPAAARPDVRRMLQPLGPVAVFAASNFPFAFSTAGGDTASALAAGCPVVVKAHEGHPHTTERVAAVVTRVLADAGVPPGVFGVVFGAASGGPLVRHPGICAVGFTGSTAGGRALFDLACSRPDPIPFFGELGSVNPVVVLPDAAAQRPAAIAAGYVGSLTLGAGQFCTNPGLLFTPLGTHLLDEIAGHVAGVTGAPMLSGRIHDGYVASVEGGAWSGLALVGEGTADGSDGPWAAKPEVRQVSLADFAANVDQLAAERFGPAGLVVGYDSVDDLLPVLATLPGSLTATLHAEPSELEEAGRVAESLSRLAGRLVWNGWPTGVAVCWAMHHGGPWPSSTSSAHTSVGATAIRRWLTPVAFQDWPDALLPAALQDGNPLGILRTTR